MKFFISLAFLALLLGGSLGVAAQGACPAGQYPVSGQGWNYCADIPGYEKPSETHPSRNIVWMNKWLSLTVDTAKGVVSTGVSTDSQAASESVSMGDCVRQGGTNCRPKVTVMNGCIALAVGSSKMASDLAATVADAESKALRACSADDSTCKIYISKCALPEQVAR